MGGCALCCHSVANFRNRRQITVASFGEIQSSADAALERAIISILQGHVSKAHRITRNDLVLRAVNNPRITSADDRKVRLAIASLQSQGYPILSDSGAGGYWLGEPDEIEGYIAELESRRATLADKIQALRNSRKVAKQPIQERLL